MCDLKNAIFFLCFSYAVYVCVFYIKEFEICDTMIFSYVFVYLRFIQHLFKEVTDTLKNILKNKIIQLYVYQIVIIIIL